MSIMFLGSLKRKKKTFAQKTRDTRTSITTSLYNNNNEKEEQDFTHADF